MITINTQNTQDQDALQFATNNVQAALAFHTLVMLTLQDFLSYPKWQQNFHSSSTSVCGPMADPIYRYLCYTPLTHAKEISKAALLELGCSPEFVNSLCLPKKQAKKV